MTGAVHVRPAATDDLPRVLELLAQLHPSRPEVPSVVDAGATWSQMLAEPGRTVFVAEVDGDVRGTADLLLVANLTRDARPWSIVENVVVDEVARGKGGGR